MTEPLIALLTDFGLSDPYVGVMKGVIATHCPSARMVDITHYVSPQGIRQAAYLLRSAYRYFPSHTVFLVVVDPGVGTERRPVAIQADHGMYVGPDNGVFSGVLDEVDSWQAVVLWPPEHLSATFHGRDLFAPVAAQLACGCSLSDVGTPTVDLVRTPLPRVNVAAQHMLEGEVLHIDHFGNIVTSLGPFEWRSDERELVLVTKPDEAEVVIEASEAEVVLGTQHIFPICAMYGATQPNELLALINSDRQLEIAINQGNAAWLTSAKIGDPVQLYFSAQDS
ncbi:MAG: SAM-dependent chlorinase/fluorinase [Anaerolineae bacterium]|nr:SAM-dependent chlorinase/fluorinase [Anaerolineae bacterium]